MNGDPVFDAMRFFAYEDIHRAKAEKQSRAAWRQHLTERGREMAGRLGIEITDFEIDHRRYGSLPDPRLGLGRSLQGGAVMPYALLIDNHDKANPRPWVAAGADAESVIERIAPDISRKRAKAFHLIGFFKNAKRARKAGVGKFRERGFTVGNWYPTFPDIWTADIEEVRQ